MPILLQPETEKLIQDRMRKSGYTSADAMLRAALETLDVFDADDLDEDTIRAIDQAEAEYARGEGMPLDQAIAELKRKHFGV